MKEYGSTWRTRGIFGVSSALALPYVHFLTSIPEADGRPNDGGSESFLFTCSSYSGPIAYCRFLRRSNTCSTSQVMIIPLPLPTLSVMVPPSRIVLGGLTQSFYPVETNGPADAKTRLDDDELIAEMATLTIAAHDTTSVTLSFALYKLVRHPEYQERMYREIGATRANITAHGGTEFTTEDLDSLTLSGQCHQGERY